MSDQTGVVDPLGQAAGTQAQYGDFLRLFTRLVQAVQGAAKGNPYLVYPWTTPGNLAIATAFPSIQTGTISVRQGTPGALNVTLPASGGPWIVGDGAGVAGANNITVLPSPGQTIKGAASLVISTNWKFLMFVLDGNNWNVVGL